MVAAALLRRRGRFRRGKRRRPSIRRTIAARPPRRPGRVAAGRPTASSSTCFSLSQPARLRRPSSIDCRATAGVTPFASATRDLIWRGSEPMSGDSSSTGQRRSTRPFSPRRARKAPVRHCCRPWLGERAAGPASRSARRRVSGWAVRPRSPGVAAHGPSVPFEENQPSVDIQAASDDARCGRVDRVPASKGEGRPGVTGGRRLRADPRRLHLRISGPRRPHLKAV